MPSLFRLGHISLSFARAPPRKRTARACPPEFREPSSDIPKPRAEPPAWNNRQRRSFRAFRRMCRDSGFADATFLCCECNEDFLTHSSIYFNCWWFVFDKDNFSNELHSSYVMIIIMWTDMMKLITWLNTKTEVRLMYFKQEIMPNIKCFKLLWNVVLCLVVLHYGLPVLTKLYILK